jgi:hypothetical protein
MISVLIFAVDAKLRRTLEQLPKREETKAPKRLRTDQRDHCRDMTHASNPANSALLAQSWEISVCEKVRGGGRGQGRTCLSDKFPGNREINREVCEIQPFAAIYASSQRTNSIACRQIPYAMEQGKFKWTSGKICRRTEKFIAAARRP